MVVDADRCEMKRHDRFFFVGDGWKVETESGDGVDQSVQ